MEELDLKIYVKVLLKNWKWIVIFVGLTLVTSSIFNFAFKKPLVPEYRAEGSIDVTGVTSVDKTTPSILIDKETEQKLLDNVANELKLNKSDYAINIDTTTLNLVKISGNSLKSEGMEKYINRIMHDWAEQYKQQNNFDVNIALTSLKEENKNAIIDENGKISILLLEEKIKKLNKEEVIAKNEIRSYKAKINDNVYKIELTKYLIDMVKQRAPQSSNIELNERTRKYVDLESNLDSYLFSKSFSNNEIIKANEELKQISILRPIYTTLYNDKKIIIKDATLNQVIIRDTRVRSVIISLFLSFVLICSFVLLKEYFLASKSVKKEGQSSL